MNVKVLGRNNIGGEELIRIRRNYSRMTPDQIYGKDSILARQALHLQKLATGIATRIGHKRAESMRDLQVAAKSLWLYTKFDVPNYGHNLLRDFIEQNSSSYLGFVIF